MRKILLLLALAVPSLSFSTSPNDTINFNDIDIQFLESLVKEQIDSIRRSHGLHSLRYDFSLNKASEDHAFYLMKHQEVSHHQKFYKKRNVLQRVAFFGAENVQKAGENVLWKHPRRKYVWDAHKRSYRQQFYYTYHTLSQSIIKSWLNSPAHYKNLLTPNYQHTAVAIAFDSRSKDLTCVQVFAAFFPPIDNQGVAGTN